MSNNDREGSRPPGGGSPPSHADAAWQRAWRSASGEQPPAGVDAAIIAAARESVRNPVEERRTTPARSRSRNRLTQWQPLAAAAAVTGLAFFLVQLLPREHTLAPPAQRRDVPTQRAVPAPPSTHASPTAAEKANAADAGPTNELSRSDPEPLTGAAASDAAAPATAVPRSTERSAEPSAADAAGTSNATDTLGEISANRHKAVAEQRREQSATAVSAARAPPAVERSHVDALPDPATWATEVVALHQSGNVTAAELELRRFRAAHADADSYLPDSLRDWAGTVE